MIRPALLLLTAAIAAVPANAAERRFDASGFDKVAVGGSDNVSVRQGDGYSVIASGEAADLDKLEVRVEKGVLHIGRKKGNWGWGGKDVNVAVTLPALHGLSVAGSADVQADKGSGDVFDLRVAGSGNLMLASLDTRTANVAISGSGDVKVAGRRSLRCAQCEDRRQWRCRSGRPGLHQHCDQRCWFGQRQRARQRTGRCANRRFWRCAHHRRRPLHQEGRRQRHRAVQLRLFSRASGW